MNIFIALILSSLSFAEPTKIHIAYPAAGTIVSAQIGLIFEKTDILKNHGFAAQVSSIGTGRELKTAMVSGGADVILTSEANFVVLLGQGYDARALNSLGSAGRLALVVAENSKFKTLGDLKDRTIATIFGTSLHQPAVEWAAQAGGAKVISIDQNGALLAALHTGVADAIMTYDPFLTDLLAEHKVRILKEDHFNLITVISGAFLKAHSADAVRLNAAFGEAIQFMRKNVKTVDGWFSVLAKLKMDSIEKSSAFNTNYSGRDSIHLEISDEFRKKLDETGIFLFHEKLIRAKPDLTHAFL